MFRKGYGQFYPSYIYTIQFHRPLSPNFALQRNILLFWLFSFFSTIFSSDHNENIVIQCWNIRVVRWYETSQILGGQIIFNKINLSIVRQNNSFFLRFFRWNFVCLLISQQVVCIPFIETPLTPPFCIYL